MENTGKWSELLTPIYKKIYGDAYGSYPEEYSKFMNVETSGKAYEDTLSMGLFGLAHVKIQGHGVDYDEALQGYTHRLTNITYGLGFIVTSEMWEDDLYGKMKKLPKALARSVRHTVEILGANILNNGFSSSYTGADGVELFSLLHPLLGGGTWANEPAVSTDLSMTSYEQALIDIQAFVDDRGLLAVARPKKLVVATANDWTCQQLLKSEYDPETNFNAINPAKGTIPYMVGHWLTDPDAWFIITDVPDGIVFYWRRRPKFTEDNEFSSENGLWKTTFRCIQGWDDPRGAYGSSGG